MLLSSQEIHARLKREEIRIDPFDADRLNPNGYNLSLHSELLVYEEIVLDVAVPNRYRRLEIPPEGLVLQPNLLYLGRTAEYTETHGVVPMIQGRSSLSRLGLFINPGGAVGDVGYCGTWTLEMHCVQPLKIYPGMQVCQIFYQELCGQGECYSSGKYQHSREVQPSLMYREFAAAQDENQMELNFDDQLGQPSQKQADASLSSSAQARLPGSEA